MRDIDTVLPRRAGRPVGTTIPESERRRRCEVTLPAGVWALATDTGNASRYIEQLIRADQERRVHQDYADDLPARHRYNPRRHVETQDDASE